jgi:protein-histidine pros-kinase
MNLLTKFNLILLTVFGVGALAISQLTYSFLMENARREVLNQAELMMASAKSIRDYTSADLRPLLEGNPLHKKRFLAETVPAFAALSTFNRLRQDYPDYGYHEATLNPTNLEHRAADWETDVIAYLRDHPGQKQLDGERQTALGPYLYIASPLVADPPCMECHSRPDLAPAAMVATYGSSNGFDWKPGSVVAAQIVSVPMSVPVLNAKREFRLILIYLAITLFATIVGLDAAMYFIVIRPLKRVSDAGDRVSKGEMDLPPLPVKSADEIATVTASFNRMQVSLAKALKMLG